MAGLGVNAGVGFALREGARALFKLMGPANALSGVIAAGGTWAMGMSAIKYFIDGGSMEEARAAFEKAKRDGAPPELMAGGEAKLDDDEPEASAAGEPSADSERE
jgi:hypothetical protein